MNKKEFFKVYWATFIFIGIANLLTVNVCNWYIALWSAAVGLIAVAYVLIKVGIRG